jgi:hypothetical protein
MSSYFSNCVLSLFYFKCSCDFLYPTFDRSSYLKKLYFFFKKANHNVLFMFYQNINYKKF